MRRLPLLLVLFLLAATTAGAGNLVVLFTNDVRGNLEPSDLLGARRAAFEEEQIRVELALAGGLWITKCDPNQLESAILKRKKNDLFKTFSPYGLHIIYMKDSPKQDVGFVLLLHVFL